MRNAIIDQGSLRNAMLAEALSHTVAELRLIEPSDMIAYIRADQWPNIADLVQSSAELSFREGALSFACSASFQVGWSVPTSISLDMEFQAGPISAFFTLVLGDDESLVDIKHLWFSVTPSDDREATHVLSQALAEARLPSASAWLGQSDTQ